MRTIQFNENTGTGRPGHIIVRHYILGFFIKIHSKEIELPRYEDELIAKYSNLPDDEEPVAKPAQEIKPISLSPVSSPAAQKKTSPVSPNTFIFYESYYMTHIVSVILNDSYSMNYTV